MLISITDKCRMNCPHCMDNALGDNNNFMTEDVFLDSVKFNFDRDKTLTLTGGEPTEHPNFWNFLDILRSEMPNNSIVTVTTNGMNIDKDDGTLLRRIKKLNENPRKHILFQVTSVKGLYPIQIDLSNPIFRLDTVTVCDELQVMVPIGRAVVNRDRFTFNSKAPHCFNLRSLTRRFADYKIAIQFLRNSFKFCTPQIDYKGDIKLGESCLCPCVASIYDTDAEITEKIISFRCSQCSELLNKLPQEYRKAIGEA